MTAAADDLNRSTAARMAIIGYADHAMVVRLRTELLSRGHDVDVVDPRLLGTALDGGHETVVGMRTRPPTVVLLSVSTDQIAATRAAGVMERSGLPVVNPSAAVLLAADKFAAASVMAAAGLPVPRTVNVCTADAVVQVAHRMGWPVVLKAADGSEGVQVVMLRAQEDVGDAVAGIRTSLGLDPSVRSSLVVQEVVDVSLGRDRRIVVVGGAVQASMDRLARTGEWRSNMSLGARPVAAQTSAEEEQVATAAAAALGLDFGTVDVMASANGPVVIEVNAFGDVLDVAMVNRVDLIGCLADVMEMRAGLRPPAPVVARPLTGAALEELSAFCWTRWYAKLDDLDRLDAPGLSPVL